MLRLNTLGYLYLGEPHQLGRRSLFVTVPQAACDTVQPMNDKTVREYLAGIGRKGGQAGTGKRKVRGNAEYYKRISAKAAKARNDKRKQRKIKS